MDKLKDILNNIKDRFTNPLIFSFLCSWLIVNWRITLSLLWYDTEQIKRVGASSIYKFIEWNINSKDCLWTPLGFAVLYTLAAPVIKNLVSAFYEWCMRWGSNWNLRISKGIKIPFDKYLKLKADYEKRSQILEEEITKESELTQKYQTINTDLLQAKAEINSLSQQRSEVLNTLNQLYDIRILNGYWVNSYEDPSHSRLKGFEDIYIQDGKYFLIENFGNQNHVFNITNFYYDNRNRTIFFIKERVNFPNTGEVQNNFVTLRYNINVLTIEREDLLVGIENGNTKIQYQKKDSLKLKENSA